MSAEVFNRIAELEAKVKALEARVDDMSKGAPIPETDWPGQSRRKVKPEPAKTDA